jgi:hypothetical protein
VSNLKEKEITALNEGNIVVIGENKTPAPATQNIWFVWYRGSNSANDDYRILLKTFNTKKTKTVKIINKMREKFDNEIGIGRLSMFNGKMTLYKPLVEDKVNEN